MGISLLACEVSGFHELCVLTEVLLGLLVLGQGMGINTFLCVKIRSNLITPVVYLLAAWMRFADLTLKRFTVRLPSARSAQLPG